jgi:protein SCO1/2
MPGDLLWGLPIMLALAFIAALVIAWAEKSKSAIPDLGEVPAFQLTERSGQELTRADMMGRLFVVDFFFTNCPSVCPLMTRTLKPLYDLYKNSDKVRFLSISVDPASDSLTALQAFAKEYGITDNRWLFARAPIEDVRKLMREGFMLNADDLPAGHPTYYILVDDKAHIRGFYPFNEEGAIYVLKQHIRELAREM